MDVSQKNLGKVRSRPTVRYPGRRVSRIGPWVWSVVFRHRFFFSRNALSSGRPLNWVNPKITFFFYERVLCRVPCAVVRWYCPWIRQYFVRYASTPYWAFLLGLFNQIWCEGEGDSLFEPWKMANVLASQVSVKTIQLPPVSSHLSDSLRVQIAGENCERSLSLFLWARHIFFRIMCRSPFLMHVARFISTGKSCLWSVSLHATSF